MKLVLCSEHFLCRCPTGHSEEFIERRTHRSRVGTAVSIQPRARPGPMLTLMPVSVRGARKSFTKTVNDSQKKGKKRQRFSASLGSHSTSRNQGLSRGSSHPLAWVTRTSLSLTTAQQEWQVPSRPRAWQNGEHSLMCTGLMRMDISNRRLGVHYAQKSTVRRG